MGVTCFRPECKSTLKYLTFPDSFTAQNPKPIVIAIFQVRGLTESKGAMDRARLGECLRV